MVKCSVCGQEGHRASKKRHPEYEGKKAVKKERTRDTAKANEDKDIEFLLQVMNDPTNLLGTKLKEEFHKKFGKRLLAARRCDASTTGKKAGGRSVHYDFQIQTEEGWFHVEHKGSQQFLPIDPSLPPWASGVQFHNGGMEKYRLAKKYAEAWYKKWVGSGLLKQRYGIKAEIPSLDEWMKKDAKVQGNPGTAFSKELKKTYRALHNEKKVSLTAERDEFVIEFLKTCTAEDCELLKQDILPILKEAFETKQYWLQIHGSLASGNVHCAWTKQLSIPEIKKIDLVISSDIWAVIACENNFYFGGLLRFGKGSGFSNVRIDLRDPPKSILPH